MALSLDATASAKNSGSSSLTYSHTCASGAVLVVFVDDGDSGTDSVTGVTYGGAALTKIGSIEGPNNDYESAWFLATPASGTNNVVVTRSSSSNELAAASESWLGASTSTPTNFVKTADRGDEIRKAHEREKPVVHMLRTLPCQPICATSGWGFVLTQRAMIP